MEQDETHTLNTGGNSGQDGQPLICPSCQMRLGSSTLICPNDGTVVRARLDGRDDLSAKYLFVEEIGAGGMGVVYKAEHILTKRVVAIKMLLADKLTPASIMRFQREAQAASKLSHPNLVTTLDFGVTSHGRPYMVMDYLEGKTLQAIIKEKGQLSVQETKDIFLQICDGLEYAHANDVLHRDLKPSNVLILGSKNDRYNVKIVDFGIAKLLNDSKTDLPTLTETGAMLGTPLYMSPELVLGKELDVRSDVYSLGCVMYECLTGIPPLSGNNAMETALKHVNNAPTTLKEASFGVNFPERIESLLKKSLEKEPDQRFQSISQFKEALIDPAGDGLVQGAKIPDLNARNRTVQLLLVSILLIGGLALLVYAFIPKQIATTVVPSPEIRSTLKPESKTTDADVESNREFLNDFEKIKSTTEEEAVSRNISDLEIKSPMRVSAEMVRTLSRNPAIRALVFKDVMFNDDMLKEIRAMPLESLTLNRTGVSNKGLILLNPRITKLALVDQNVIDSGVKSLLRLTNLKELSLEGNPISNQAIETLRQMKYLTRLDITRDDEITGEVVDILVKMPLRSLVIDEMSIQDSDMERLCASPTIISLAIDCGKITDRGVKAISKMKLNDLELTGGRFRDASLVAVSQMNELRKLTFHPPNQKFFPEGFKAMEGTKLSQLILENVLLTAQNAEELGRIKTLKILKISHSKLSESSYKSLTNALPQCRITVQN